MKERPILMSAPMVRAILDGRKTQTRRTVKPQPPAGCEYVINGAHSHALCRQTSAPSIWVAPTPKSIEHRMPCPYGKPGDRLWVKETWFTPEAWDSVKPTELPILDTTSGIGVRINYSADLPPGSVILGRLRPSIFMRRWMSRITLEVVSVRVERLQDISEADAHAEGVEPTQDQFVGAALAGIFGAKHLPYASAYAKLWETINGFGSWDANPWVWVVEFKRITP